MKPHRPRPPLTKEQEDRLYEYAVSSPHEQAAQRYLAEHRPDINTDPQRQHLRFEAEFEQGPAFENMKETIAAIEERVMKEAAAISHVMGKTREQTIAIMYELGEQFIEAAEEGDEDELSRLAAKGAPVNYAEPGSGFTALHYVASNGVRPAVRFLLSLDHLDVLLRDARGRRASQLAEVSARDRELADLIRQKEIEQAKERGIDLLKPLKPPRNG